MQQQAPSVLVVSNPIAGGGVARLSASVLADALSKSGCRCRSIDSQPGDARAWLTRELAGVDLVVAVGGDGAVRQAAAAIRASDRGSAATEPPSSASARGRATHLWVSPSGTENLFARALGMEGGPTALLRAIDARRTTVIDLGWARPLRDSSGATPAPPAAAGPVGSAAGDPIDAMGETQEFVLMASCGFDAEVVARLAAGRRGAISHASYMGPILRSLWGYRSPRCTLEIDGSVRSATGGAIVANGPRYAFGIDPMRAARFDDGALHAALLPGGGGVAALLVGAKCIAGIRPVGLACQRVRVRTDRPMTWQFDGDPSPWGPVAAVEFGLHRRAVRILLPAPRVPGEFDASLREALESPPVEWTLGAFDEEV